MKHLMLGDAERASKAKGESSSLGGGSEAALEEVRQKPTELAHDDGGGEDDDDDMDLEAEMDSVREQLESARRLRDEMLQQRQALQAEIDAFAAETSEVADGLEAEQKGVVEQAQRDLAEARAMATALEAEQQDAIKSLSVQAKSLKPSAD